MNKHENRGREGARAGSRTSSPGTLFPILLALCYLFPPPCRHVSNVTFPSTLPRQHMLPFFRTATSASVTFPSTLPPSANVTFLDPAPPCCSCPRARDSDNLFTSRSGLATSSSSTHVLAAGVASTYVSTVILPVTVSCSPRHPCSSCTVMS